MCLLDLSIQLNVAISHKVEHTEYDIVLSVKLNLFFAPFRMSY